MDYPKFDPLELLEQAGEEIARQAKVISQLIENQRALNNHFTVQQRMITEIITRLIVLEHQQKEDNNG